jgi:hypothetical protein
MAPTAGSSSPGDGGVADQVALRALVDAYAAAADDRDPVAFAELFVPDGELSARRGDGEPTVYVGHERLAEIPERLRRYDHTFHHVAYHRSAIDGDTATGVAGCRAHHVTATDHGATDLVLTIRYRDAYRRTPKGWRFARREVHILWTGEHPVNIA